VTKKERALEVTRRLDSQYGSGPKVYLKAENAWQLLFATILSAQCTDRRVNMITEELYKKYRSIQAFADADIKSLEQDIKSAGLYKTKARNIKACARMLLDEFDGRVPSDIDELTSLPGVGRKTANVIRGNIFNIPSIVVDTHVGRISRKLNLTKENDPVKVEHDLERVIPKDHWISYNIQIITLGRTICTARNPKCSMCFLKDICPSAQKNIQNKS
jgi:endonuclease-3